MEPNINTTNEDVTQNKRELSKEEKHAQFLRMLRSKGQEKEIIRRNLDHVSPQEQLERMHRIFLEEYKARQTEKELEEKVNQMVEDALKKALQNIKLS